MCKYEGSTLVGRFLLGVRNERKVLFRIVKLGDGLLFKTFLSYITHVNEATA